MTSVVPMDTLVFEWDRPANDGCLPILSYTLWKDGSDHITGIASTATLVTDDISAGGVVGAQIVYKIKALNVNGESSYSEPLVVTVGLIPNPLMNLAVIQHFSASSMQVTWEDGAEIPNNPET
jgi:hypothetical protein